MRIVVYNFIDNSAQVYDTSILSKTRKTSKKTSKVLQVAKKPKKAVNKRVRHSRIKNYKRSRKVRQVRVNKGTNNKPLLVKKATISSLRRRQSRLRVPRVSFTHFRKGKNGRVSRLHAKKARKKGLRSTKGKSRKSSKMVNRRLRNSIKKL